MINWATPQGGRAEHDATYVTYIRILSHVQRAFSESSSSKEMTNKKEKICQIDELSRLIFYLKEGEPFVAIDDHFKALVVDEGEEAGVPKFVRGHRQFLQGQGHRALPCG